MSANERVVRAGDALTVSADERGKPDVVYVERAWQPIETAPRVRGADGQLGVCVATPWGSRWAFNHAWWDDIVEEWTDISSDRYLKPTHWTPLPKPPL